ncbi:MAG TPA: DUF4870 domain-containing protein [Blastocatellia bacterium]|nr:DUF4870 domain-containing protein [Blastocatellia bacterium]
MSNPPPGGKTKVLSLDYNVAAMLCYLPICCISIIVPILIVATEPKENKFVRFHALQSLFLTGVIVVLFGILWVLSIVLAVGSSTAGSAGSAAGAGIGLLILLVECVVGLVLLIVFIMGMLKAYKYEIWKLPVIGDLADKNS